MLVIKLYYSFLKNIKSYNIKRDRIKKKNIIGIIKRV